MMSLVTWIAGVGVLLELRTCKQRSEQYFLFGVWVFTIAITVWLWVGILQN